MSDFDHLNGLTTAITPRPSSNLNFDANAVLARQARLVLDTNAIISALKKKLPDPVRALIAQSRTVASSIVVGEMTQGMFNLKPSHPGTAAARLVIQSALQELGKIDPLTPTHEDWALANALLSALHRTNNFDKNKRREMLTDALIYVSARAAQACVVTANTTDFDLLEQALPGGQVLYFTPLAKASSP